MDRKEALQRADTLYRQTGTKAEAEKRRLSRTDERISVLVKLPKQTVYELDCLVKAFNHFKDLGETRGKFGHGPSRKSLCESIIDHFLETTCAQDAHAVRDMSNVPDVLADLLVDHKCRDGKIQKRSRKVTDKSQGVFVWAHESATKRVIADALMKEAAEAEGEDK